jgi:hypothetical protein
MQKVCKYPETKIDGLREFWWLPDTGDAVVFEIILQERKNINPAKKNIRSYI